VSAYLVFMQDYLNEAVHIQARDWSPKADERTLEVVRKVTALGMACMEQHGAPRRVDPAAEHPVKSVEEGGGL
jgi:hypothetical protein